MIANFRIECWFGLFSNQQKLVLISIIKIKISDFHESYFPQASAVARTTHMHLALMKLRCFLGKFSVNNNLETLLATRALENDDRAQYSL